MALYKYFSFPFPVSYTCTQMGGIEQDVRSLVLPGLKRQKRKLRGNIGWKACSVYTNTCPQGTHIQHI